MPSKISDLPAGAAPAAGDLVEGETVAGNGVRWTIDQIAAAASAGVDLTAIVGDIDANTDRTNDIYNILQTVTGLGQVTPAGAADALGAPFIIDQVTRRLAIGGIELGDTGWRDVSANLINGWTGTLWLRRVGSVITVRADLDGTGATGGQSDVFTHAPDGFHPTSGGWVPFPILDTAAGSVAAADVTVDVGVILANGWMRAPKHDGVLFVYSFPAGDPWPTSLPGTAA